jgi:hypothetical protein
MFYYSKNKDVKGIDKIMDMAMTRIQYDAQEAFFGIFANFPIPLIGPAMNAVTFPLGREYGRPTDKQRAIVSDMITTPTEVRSLLTQDVFVSKNPKDRVAMIAQAMPLCFEADKIMAACRKEKRTPTAEEQTKIDQAEALREEIIQVDSFPVIGKEHNTEWMKPTWSVGNTVGVSVEKAAPKQQHA